MEALIFVVFLIATILGVIEAVGRKSVGWGAVAFIAAGLALSAWPFG